MLCVESTGFHVWVVVGNGLGFLYVEGKTLSRFLVSSPIRVSLRSEQQNIRISSQAHEPERRSKMEGRVIDVAAGLGAKPGGGRGGSCVCVVYLFFPYFSIASSSTTVTGPGK